MKPPDTSLLSFPCDFSIKVMGKADTDFEKEVYRIIKKHVTNLKENALSQRPSRNGNYLAITIRIEAQSKQQLDNIYHDLTASDQVLMAI